MKLAEKIFKLRKERGLTIEQLAKKTNFSKEYIWELENSITSKPSTEKLSIIATVLNTNIKFLLDNDSQDKTAVSLHFDKELMAKIDKDAAKNMRTRKAQVMYIISQYYLNKEEK
jgi:transcriptional regulator with XRE-family HTH domain